MMSSRMASFQEVMNKNPVSVQDQQSVADLFAAFQETHLGGFPVLTSDNKLYGMVTMQDMERTIQAMERTLERKEVNLRDLRVWDVATPDPVTVFFDEPIWSAIRKMAPRDLARLPVVARNNPRQFVGLISRSDIVRAYDVGLVDERQPELGFEEVKTAAYVKERLDALDLEVHTGIAETSPSSGTALPWSPTAALRFFPVTRLPSSVSPVSGRRSECSLPVSRNRHPLLLLKPAAVLLLLSIFPLYEKLFRSRPGGG